MSSVTIIVVSPSTHAPCVGAEQGTSWGEAHASGRNNALRLLQRPLLPPPPLPPWPLPPVRRPVRTAPPAPTWNCTMLLWRQVRRMEISFQKSSAGTSSCRGSGYRDGENPCCTRKSFCVGVLSSAAALPAASWQRSGAQGGTPGGNPTDGSLHSARLCMLPRAPTCRARLPWVRPPLRTPAACDAAAAAAGACAAPGPAHLRLEDLDSNRVHAVQEGLVDLR